MSSLSGGRNRSSRTKQHEAQVDGSEYAEAVKSCGDGAAKMFVGQVKASQ